MIIQQTTTLIFQYPQDYMQEQEWCKTKDDRWIHKGTDTLGAVYENQISYSIGSSVSVKTEPRKEQNFCGKCRYLYRDFKYGLSCYRLMDNEPCKYADRKTEPTISKMEQVDKDINVRSKERSE